MFDRTEDPTSPVAPVRMSCMAREDELMGFFDVDEKNDKKNPQD